MNLAIIHRHSCQRASQFLWLSDFLSNTCRSGHSRSWLRGYAAAASSTVSSPTAKKAHAPQTVPHVNRSPSPKTQRHGAGGIRKRMRSGPTIDPKSMTDEQKIKYMEEAANLMHLNPLQNTRMMMLQTELMPMQLSSYPTKWSQPSKWKAEFQRRLYSTHALWIISSPSQFGFTSTWPQFLGRAIRGWQKYWMLATHFIFPSTATRYSVLSSFPKEALSIYEKIFKAAARGDKTVVRKHTFSSFQTKALSMTREPKPDIKIDYQINSGRVKVITVRANPMYGRVKVVEGGHPLNLQILARVDTVQSLRTLNNRKEYLDSEGKWVKGERKAIPRKVTEYLVFENCMWEVGGWRIRDQFTKANL